MLHALDAEDPRSAYPVPWRVHAVYDTHPLVTNESTSAVDFVRVFVAAGRSDVETELWGRMLPGETVELCLCDRDPAEVLITLGWFRSETGVEYIWRFTV
jgi:hypothetical protein